MRIDATVIVWLGARDALLTPTLLRVKSHIDLATRFDEPSKSTDRERPSSRLARPGMARNTWPTRDYRLDLRRIKKAILFKNKSSTCYELRVSYSEYRAQHARALVKLKDFIKNNR